MSLFSMLRVGESGTKAAQYGVNTVSENIANVNTPGYARRTATQETGPSYRIGSLEFGMGARTLSAQRVVDQTLTERTRRASAGASYAESRSSHLARAEAVFADLDGAGLSPAIDRVFDSFTRLAAAPQDRTARAETLAAATDFASEISRYGTDVRNERLALNDEVRNEVDAINRITREVAELNRTIGSSDPKPNDLLDRRDALLDDLASRVDIDVLQLDDGQVSVNLRGGPGLVYETHSTPLSVQTNVNGMVEVHQLNAGADQDLTAQIRTGSLGGILATRDEDLATVEAQIDQYAFDFANAVNAVHAAGYGADGVTGRNLFTAPTQVAGAAAGMSVDAAVAGDPDAVAAATDPLLLPGDNRNATALAALKDQASVGGQTPGAGFRGVLQEMGDRLASASLSAESTGLARDQLQTMRSSLEGVSLDEEMAALIQYRTAYQAAAQVIRTADELLQETINLKR
jgi:flagellar hook-associated protein 1 FlgK